MPRVADAPSNLSCSSRRFISSETTRFGFCSACTCTHMHVQAHARAARARGTRCRNHDQRRVAAERSLVLALQMRGDAAASCSHELDSRAATRADTPPPRAGLGMRLSATRDPLPGNSRPHSSRPPASARRRLWQDRGLALTRARRVLCLARSASTCLGFSSVVFSSWYMRPSAQSPAERAGENVGGQSVRCR